MLYVHGAKASDYTESFLGSGAASWISTLAARGRLPMPMGGLTMSVAERHRHRP
jgi:hypothetical protein